MGLLLAIPFPIGANSKARHPKRRFLSPVSTCVTRIFPARGAHRKFHARNAARQEPRDHVRSFNALAKLLPLIVRRMSFCARDPASSHGLNLRFKVLR